MKLVYLDQNKWIDLGRAYHGRPSGVRFSPALQAARAAVADGRAVFPLSSTHYMETTVRQEDGSRHRLVDVMEELSGFTTMREQSVIVPFEIRHALHELYAEPAEEPELDLLGFGPAHAFDSPALGFEPPAEVPPAQRDALVAVGQMHVARELLRHGIKDPTLLGQHRTIDTVFAQSADKFGAKLRAAGFGKGAKLRTAMVGSIAFEILDPVTQAGTPVEVFDSQASLERFIRAMPSRWAMLELQYARQAARTPFEAGDLRDLGALAVAFAYCDVVVTEKQWVHIAKMAKLDEIFGTTITPDVAELETILAAPDDAKAA